MRSQELQPPVLVADVQAVYPQAAKADGVEGSVMLRLTIDVEGRVLEADVLEPAGHGFDEAARAAALQLRFQPARRNGEPVPAKIRFPYEFRISPPPAASAVIEGQLRMDGRPAARAEVQVSAPATPASVITDAAGRFRLERVPPGTWQLTAALGGRSLQQLVVVAAGETSRLELSLPPARLAASAKITEVTVAGARSEGERLQLSAAAVNVVDTRKAQRQTADLGEVLARTQGVAVRRYGGLGTSARFSLNGLYDEQVRFFLDDIPLDIAGFPLGIANVPVNLVERAEVYRGVVPVRFGADALGGAVNLVTDRAHRPRLAASYQIGSFGTHRVTLDGRYRHDPSGLVAGATAFLDITSNDYDIDVDVPDDRGRLVPTTVPRFHDGYRAFGATLEAGLVDRSWARRLLVKGLFSSYDKQLQNNIVMSVPYGEVTYGETSYGASLRYEVAPVQDLELELIGSYTHRAIDYVDKGEWVYDWYGQRVRRRRVPGEVEAQAHDQSEWQHSLFGRTLVTWSIRPGHTLRASLSPAFASRSGDERLQADPTARDPLTARRELFTFVSGLEYELSVLGDHVANVLFVKDYYYQARGDEPLVSGTFREHDRITHNQGAGDSLRVRVTPWLYVKASYEYATRLPTAYEVFGNGVLIRPNLDLQPEVSHNGNLGPRLELTQRPFGDLTVDISAFWRESQRLIVLLGTDRYFTYQNVYEARALGLEHALRWSSPRRWLSLDGTLTWQDVRNVSKEGTFANTRGDRIPNRPYLFASWGARVRLPSFSGEHDTLEPFYDGRYVHQFFRAWESQGLRDFKQTVDSQVTHSVGVSWTVQRDYAAITSTLEVDNLTDARVYDNYGAQRPGRAFYLKLTGELR